MPSGHTGVRFQLGLHHVDVRAESRGESLGIRIEKTELSESEQVGTALEGDLVLSKSDAAWTSAVVRLEGRQVRSVPHPNAGKTIIGANHAHTVSASKTTTIKLTFFSESRTYTRPTQVASESETPGKPPTDDDHFAWGFNLADSRTSYYHEKKQNVTYWLSIKIVRRGIFNRNLFIKIPVEYAKK